MRAVALIAAVLVPAAVTEVPAQVPGSIRAVDPARFDTTCAPCTDFFRYANGGWDARTEIPPQYTGYGVGREVQDRTEALLHKILEDAAREASRSSDSTTRLVGTFYRSCMDSVRAQREGAAPLRPQLRRIAAIRTRGDLAEVLGELQRQRFATCSSTAPTSPYSSRRGEGGGSPPAGGDGPPMTRSGPARQRHLVDVWNPSYASEAMTVHLTVLLEAAQRTRGTEDAPYVWWGRVRSPNRQQELRNLPQVLEIAQELERDDDRECHLYLADYRSLYVGLVDAITPEDVRGTDGVHVPAYYTANSLECDFWYRLLDIRRLVGDDTPVVIEKLKALRNLNYGERPVSIYGGMVDLPLRENLFGDEAWLALDPAARTFIASAEKILRDQRSDPAFDYGPIIANLAKALEVTCNAILRRVGQSLPREVRQIKIEQETIDLGAGKHLSTGQLAKVLRNRSPLHRQLRQRLENGDWFVDAFPKVLGEVADVRNPGVHRARIGREAAMRLRNALVGVGCQGAFIELAKVRAR